MTPRLRTTLATAALCLVTACGSTVQLGSGASPQGDGLSSTAPVDGGTSALEPGTATTNDPGTGTGTSSTSATPSVSAGSTRTSGSSVPGSSSPSAAATQGSSAGTASNAPIRVGVLYGKGVDKAASAIGLGSLSTGDSKAQAAAVFAYVNKHGGLGGHPIAPYYYGIEAGGDTESNYLAGCAALTQDDHVRYMVTIAGLPASTVSCFVKAGVGMLGDQLAVTDETYAKDAAYLAAPGDFAGGRMLTTLVDELWNRGWLTPKSVVGSYTFDLADYGRLVTGPLTAALKKHGLTIAVDARVTYGTSSISEASGATLKFQSAGVNRIIPVLASPVFLMTNAQSQGYHPAYAMYSTFGPGAFIEGTAPKEQLKNSIGIGWQPALDIGAGTHPAPVSPNETLCYAVMKAAGQASTSATTKAFQLQTCNVIFYLQAAAAALPAVPKDLLSASRPLLGNGFRPADTFRTDVTHRADGAAGYRSIAFTSDCSCYQYVSGVQPTP